MISTLHPEIIQNILCQACGEDDGTVAVKRNRQHQLASFMSVSKVNKRKQSSSDSC